MVFVYRAAKRMYEPGMEYSLLARRKAICRLMFKEHCCCCYIRPPMGFLFITYLHTRYVRTRRCFSNFMKVASIAYTMCMLTMEKAEDCSVRAQLLRQNADGAEAVCMSVDSSHNATEKKKQRGRGWDWGQSHDTKSCTYRASSNRRIYHIVVLLDARRTAHAYVIAPNDQQDSYLEMSSCQSGLYDSRGTAPWVLACAGVIDMILL